MIEVKKGEYCIANVSDKDANGGSKGAPKMVLFKVTGSTGDGREVHGRVERNPHIKEVTVSAQRNEVLLNLGKHPKPGKVYGFDLGRLYLGSREHHAFGEFHFFTNPEEKTTESLWNSLDTVSEKLTKHRLAGLLELPCVFEVVPKHGKHSGLYTHPKNLEKTPAQLSISVGEEILEHASIGNYTYVVLHELGHLMHFQCLAEYPKLNAQWVELFSSTIGPTYVEAERCLEIGKTLLANTEMGLRGFHSEADEDTKGDLKLILKWLREIKGVTSKEIDLLLQADTKSATKAFKANWPVVDIMSKGLKPVITEYATVNYRETFAEAFAFYMCGKKLPAEVTELVEKSIGLARNFLKSQSK